jgi:hypothetical protein
MGGNWSRIGRKHHVAEAEEGGTAANGHSWTVTCSEGLASYGLRPPVRTRSVRLRWSREPTRSSPGTPEMRRGTQFSETRARGRDRTAQVSHTRQRVTSAGRTVARPCSNQEGDASRRFVTTLHDALERGTPRRSEIERSLEEERRSRRSVTDAALSRHRVAPCPSRHARRSSA